MVVLDDGDAAGVMDALLGVQDAQEMEIQRLCRAHYVDIARCSEDIAGMACPINNMKAGRALPSLRSSHARRAASMQLSAASDAPCALLPRPLQETLYDNNYWAQQYGGSLLERLRESCELSRVKERLEASKSVVEVSCRAQRSPLYRMQLLTSREWATLGDASRQHPRSAG